MPIYSGSNEIKEIWAGNSKIKEVWAGSTKVWQMGKKMLDLPLDTIVKLKENGNWVNFKIINKGIPIYSGYGTISANFATYDASCDGIWLLRNEIESVLTSSSPTTYPNSSYANYVNTTYLNKIDPEFRNIIKDVKIPYNTGNNPKDFSDGANGFSCKAFLLSVTECGHLYTTDHDHGYDGAFLYPWISYDVPVTSDIAKLIATYNGAATRWLTRTFEKATRNRNYIISDENGKHMVTTGATSSKPLGIRPCIIVPNNTLVNDKMEIVV